MLHEAHHLAERHLALLRDARPVARENTIDLIVDVLAPHGHGEFGLLQGQVVRANADDWPRRQHVVERRQQIPVATQEEVLAWAEAKGRKLSTNEIEIWNGFMTKRGWRDEANEVLARRLKENGLTAEAGVDTMFDYIEVDEGRPARKAAL